LTTLDLPLLDSLIGAVVEETKPPRHRWNLASPPGENTGKLQFSMDRRLLRSTRISQPR
jgi:hypothetical protein